MRKRFFRFLKIGLVILPFWVNAQDAEEEPREEDHSSFIAFKFGGNVPGKGYNGTAYTDPQVSSLLGIGLEGLWLFHRNIGLKASAQWQVFRPAGIDPFSTPNYITGQIQQDWDTRMLLGGLGFSWPLYNIDLEAHVLAGPGVTRNFTKFYERQKSPAYQQNFDYAGNALWYQSGASLRLDQKPGWSISMNYDFNIAPKHPLKSTEVYGGGAAGKIESEGNKSLSFSFLSFSVLYSIPHYK